MAPALEYALSAMGICRHFPRALVFAPEKFFGLGTPHLYTIQEIYRLSDLILHNTKETMTGLLSKSTLELLIIELGSTIDLHLLPFTQLQGLVSNSLIKSTWEFLHIHSIRLCHNISLSAPRKDDVNIMTVFYQQHLPSDILEQLNKCRLYLKALIRSDLADGLVSFILVPRLRPCSGR
jgi:hypothetical protein